MDPSHRPNGDDSMCSEKGVETCLRVCCLFREIKGNKTKAKEGEKQEENTQFANIKKRGKRGK